MGTIIVYHGTDRLWDGHVPKPYATFSPVTGFWVTRQYHGATYYIDPDGEDPRVMVFELDTDHQGVEQFGPDYRVHDIDALTPLLTLRFKKWRLKPWH